jgi:hypothetical protein
MALLKEESNAESIVAQSVKKSKGEKFASLISPHGGANKLKKWS